MAHEIKNINKNVDWYVSYMGSDQTQGVSMIKALQAKIKQYEDLCANIIRELELVDDPREIAPITALESVKSMIQTLPEISVREGYFEWVG